MIKNRLHKIKLKDSTIYAPPRGQGVSKIYKVPCFQLVLNAQKSRHQRNIPQHNRGAITEKILLLVTAHLTFKRIGKWDRYTEGQSYR